MHMSQRTFISSCSAHTQPQCSCATATPLNTLQLHYLSKDKQGRVHSTARQHQKARLHYSNRKQLSAAATAQAHSPDTRQRSQQLGPPAWLDRKNRATKPRNGAATEVGPQHRATEAKALPALAYAKLLWQTSWAERRPARAPGPSMAKSTTPGGSCLCPLGPAAPAPRPHTRGIRTPCMQTPRHTAHH
jgi:hypothetical protein